MKKILGSEHVHFDLVDQLSYSYDGTILSSGEVIRTGTTCRRNVSGYNLNGLLVGSEGTLGVITEIILKLLPRPQSRKVCIYSFNDLLSAGEAVVSLGGSGLTPSAIEIMDRTTLECLEQYRTGVLPSDAAAAILVEIDGQSHAVREEAEAALSICQKAGGTLHRESHSNVEAEKLWEARRSISAALGRMAPARVGEDISVPVSKVPEMMAAIQQIAQRRGLSIAVFGHAGDGNLHPNILTDRRDQQLLHKTEAAIGDLFEAALALGGGALRGTWHRVG
ncbi:MAG: FAD-binding oxidoreductase [Thermoleophilia bacterium]